MTAQTASDTGPQPNASAVVGSVDVGQGVSITHLDRWTGPVMFWAALAFLMILTGYVCELTIATSVVARYEAMHAGLPVDQGDSAGTASTPVDGQTTPNAQTLAEGDAPTEVLHHDGTRFAWLLLCMYPLFMAESVAHRLIANTSGRREILACLFPPLRMGGRDHLTGEAIWLPRIGWAPVGPELQLRVERAFSGPMILIALAVLPLLGFEWYLQSRAVTPSWKWGIFLRFSESVIWLAFTIEFIVMLSISATKVRYCRQHWIDIVIIVLPLIAFLRILRLGRVLRLHHVAKAGRAYRLRGLGMRMFRGVLLMDLARSFIEGDIDKRLRKMRAELVEREIEVRRLQLEIDELEAELAQRDATCGGAVSPSAEPRS